MAEGSYPVNGAARALYEKLVGHPSSSHFILTPDPILYPDYYAVVKRPIALADMARAMSAGRYTLADMQRDLRRMIANAKKYNKPEAVVYQEALELEVSTPAGLQLGRYCALPSEQLGCCAQ